MSFYWIRNRYNQKNFQVHWATISQNIGDYHQKHHQMAHHRAMHDTYLHRKKRKSKNIESSEGLLLSR